MKCYLALIAVEIFFLLPEVLEGNKKNCNEKQEQGNQESPIPTLREFASNYLQQKPQLLIIFVDKILILLLII